MQSCEFFSTPPNVPQKVELTPSQIKELRTVDSALLDLSSTPNVEPVEIVSTETVTEQAQSEKIIIEDNYEKNPHYVVSLALFQKQLFVKSFIIRQK